jgi:hypothetical protein
LEPVLAGGRRTLASCRCTTSAVSSVEQSSTTMTLCGGLVWRYRLKIVSATLAASL